MSGPSRAPVSGASDMPDHLRNALVSRRIISSGCQTVPLSGGRTNHLWRVDTAKGSIVIKGYTATDTNPLFSNSPADEARLLTHLHGTGLAPDLLDAFTLPQGPVLVYAHIDGTQWQQDTRKAAHALESLHRTPPLASLPRAPDGSADLTRQTLSILSACNSAEAHTIAALKPRSPVKASGRDALLHGDPVPGNLIATDARIVFIDWQCPQRGDPVNDLALFLSPAMQHVYRGAPLTPSDRQSFLSSFSDPELAPRYHALAPWYHWRMAAYCLWRCETGNRDDRTALALELDALRP